MVGEKFGFREFQRILLLRTTPCSNSAFHLSRLLPTYFAASLLFVLFFFGAWLISLPSPIFNFLGNNLLSAERKQCFFFFLFFLFLLWISWLFLCRLIISYAGCVQGLLHQTLTLEDSLYVGVIVLGL